MSNLQTLSKDLAARLLDRLQVSVETAEAFTSSIELRPGGNLPDVPLVFLPDGSIEMITTKGKFKPPTIERVFDLINDVIQVTAKNTGVSWAHKGEDGEPNIRFTRDGSDILSSSPYVTMKVVTGRPGGLGQGTEMNSSVSQRGSILREIVRNDSDPGSMIYVMSNRRDYHIYLTVHATSAMEADKMIEWLEVTLDNNLWYFKRSGVERFFFSERMSDDTKESGGSKVFIRPLKYFVSLDRLSWYSETILKQLNLKISIGE